MFKSILIFLCMGFSSFSFAVDCSPRFDLQSNEYIYGSQSAFSDECRKEIRRENFKGMALTQKEIEYLTAKDELAKSTEKLFKLAVNKAYNLIESEKGYGDILHDQSLKTEYLVFLTDELAAEAALFNATRDSHNSIRAQIYAEEKLILETKKSYARQNLFQIRELVLDNYFINSGLSSNSVFDYLGSISDARELRSFIDGVLNSIAIPSLNSNDHFPTDRILESQRINDGYMLRVIASILLFDGHNRAGTEVYYANESDRTQTLKKIAEILEFRALKFYDRKATNGIALLRFGRISSSGDLLWHDFNGRWLLSNLIALYFESDEAIVYENRTIQVFDLNSRFTNQERTVLVTTKFLHRNNELLRDARWYSFKDGYRQYFEP